MGIRIVVAVLVCAAAAEAAPPVGTVVVLDRPVARGKQNVDVLPLTKVDLPNKKISFTLEISFSR